MAPLTPPKSGDALFSSVERVNAELFTLTYGAIVRQLLTDLEEVEEVNKQLDQMGYNIGTRLVDEFLAKSNVSRCVDFKETADTIAKLGFKMFLGVTATVTNWDAEGTTCSFVLEDNPLVDFVELPDTCQGLQYCNVLSGVIRGALEMLYIPRHLHGPTSSSSALAPSSPRSCSPKPYSSCRASDRRPSAIPEARLRHRNTLSLPAVAHGSTPSTTFASTPSPASPLSDKLQGFFFSPIFSCEMDESSCSCKLQQWSVLFAIIALLLCLLLPMEAECYVYPVVAISLYELEKASSRLLFFIHGVYGHHMFV